MRLLLAWLQICRETGVWQGGSLYAHDLSALAIQDLVPASALSGEAALETGRTENTRTCILKTCGWSICTSLLHHFWLNCGCSGASPVHLILLISPYGVFQQALQNVVYKYAWLAFLVCWFLSLPPSSICVQPLTKYYSLETWASPSWWQKKRVSSEPKLTHPILFFCLLRKMYVV